MKWIKRAEVANMLGVSYNYLRLTLEKMPGFPQPVTLSPKVIVFEEGAVGKWMQAQMNPEGVNAEAQEVPA